MKKHLTPEQIAEHVKAELRKRISWLTDEEMDKTVRTRDDDPGEWCGEYGLVWITSENGLGSWSYETVIMEALFHIAPDGYHFEPHNAAVAVAYES